MDRIYTGLSVTPAVGKAICRIVDRYLRAHKVKKAEDLPEEAQVRLFQKIDDFRRQKLIVNEYDHCWSFRHHGLMEHLKRRWQNRRPSLI